jgi:tRNA(Ile)-lysidine synthase
MPYQPLEHQILKTIRRYRLIGENDRVLVALSGGVDSVVLLHLLHRLHFQVAAAHCNFQLRGEAADADEAFCEELCRTKNIPFFSRRFETMEEAGKQGVSVQMAARSLRYRWFHELMNHHGFQSLATGHHLNDQAETVLMNLSAGKSAASLRGIPRRNGNIIRPLLDLSGNDIRQYADENHLRWQTDESNETDDYVRNFFRHQILPVIEKIQPAAVSNISRTASYLHDWNQLAEERIDQILHPCFEERENDTLLHLQTIIQHPSAGILLHTALAPFGYEGDIINEILTRAQESGKVFHSSTHTITTHRDSLIITPHRDSPALPVYLNAPGEHVIFENKRIGVTLSNHHVGSIQNTGMTASLDAGAIRFPLCIRHWAKGDFFYPLGMNSSKKLSDFFIDCKISIPEKHRIPIVCSEEDIIWVAGHRIDDRYKITDKTEQILIIHMEPHAA